MTLNMESFKRYTYKNDSGELYKKLIKYPLEDILTQVFQIDADEQERILLNLYERLAILCVSNFSRYISVKYDVLKSIIDRIQQDSLHEAFLRLFAKTSAQFDKEAICIGLFTEMSDTWDLMYIEQGKYVVGLDYDNKSFLLIDRPNWSEILYMGEMQYKVKIGRISPQTYSKKLEGKQDHLLRICTDDVIRSRMLCLLSQYITPKTIRILPEVWMTHSVVTFYHIREYMPTEFYVDKLRGRRYILDRKGVRVKFQHGYQFKEIMFLEALNHKNRTVLLFRLTFSDGGQTSGFYDIDMDLFMTAFTDYKDYKKENRLIENLVLEMYTELVCDFPKDDNTIDCLMEDDDVDYDLIYRDSKNIHYSCEIYKDYENTGEHTGKRRKFTQKPHERIHTTRELPQGWKTSEKAKQLAELHNIELKEGETFVSSYEVGKHSVREEIKRTKVNKPIE
jgi:hypothetical protein